MEVVYEKSVFSRIIEYKYKSKAENKKIEYITISDNEAVSLYDSLGLKYFPFGDSAQMEDKEKVKRIHNSLVHGITIKVEE